MRGRTARIVLGALAALCASAPAAGAATIPVDTHSDALGGLGCGLRDAIQAANTDLPSGGCPAGGGADTIVLPAGRYVLSIPGASENSNATGDLDVSSDVTIAGAGAGTTAVDGGGLDRVLDVLSGTVTISGLEVTGGRAPDGAPGTPGASGGNGEGGGGIRNAGDLTLDHVTVDRNAAGAGGAGTADAANTTDPSAYRGGEGGAGGGVLSLQTLHVSDSTIASNASGAGGPGGDAFDGASGGIGNISAGGLGGDGGAGGGVADQGAAASVVDSIVSGNRTGRGGAGGNAGAAGNSTDNSVLGGGSLGGQGGQGGPGGGVALSGGGTGVVRSAVVSNTTGSGGPGGGAGNGGSATGGSSFGGSSVGGAGGHGGDGGGVMGGSVANATLYANVTGAGAPGSDSAVPGTGTFGGVAVGGDGGRAGQGGGAWGATLANVTASVNDATASGGSGGKAKPGGSVQVDGASGDSGSGGGAANASIANSIVWGNSAGSDADCSSLTADDGTSSIGGASCTNQSHADPGLGPLEDNGGPTPTMAPQGGDPGPGELGSGTCESTDQRGVARSPDGQCDAGAYETGLHAVTDAATGVTTTGATLAGSVTPTLRATSFHFDYGTTTGYGSSTQSATAAPGAGPVAVTTALAGLAPDTTYHYRIVATSPDGDSTGSDQTFKTAAAPAPVQSGSNPTVAGDTKPPSPSPPALARGFVIDTGASVTRLGRRSTFRIPGLRFACPATASGPCVLRLAVVDRHHGSRGSLLTKRLSIAPGKTLALTLRASRALRAALRGQRLMRLRATATYAAPGTPAVTVRKLFVLLPRH